MLTLTTGAIALAITGLMSYLIWFYKRLANYPPGPTPLPFIGNILLFMRFKQHWNLEIDKLSKVYGPVMTVWVGAIPIVFVCDLQVGREAFNEYESIGRPNDVFANAFCNERHKDIIFSIGKTWENLRKLGLRVVRIFTNSETIVPIVAENMKEAVDVMEEREGRDRPFSPDQYVYAMLAKTVGEMIFSHKFDINDDDMLNFRYVSTDFQPEVGYRLFMYDFLPIVRYFIANPMQKFGHCFEKAIEFIQDIYTRHERTYEMNSKRDFCDVVITAKHKAIEEETASAVDFTDANLSTVMFDMYLGGVETSFTTWKWMLVFMGYYPDVQKRLREEVDGVLEGRVPTQEDVTQMPYTMAFICESLRLRNPLPTGLFHQSLADMTIGNHPVPNNTILMFHHQSVMLDANHWSHPHQFYPNRFMASNGKENVRNSAFCPFSIGRRICPGEKLAMVELFLTLVTFMQLTHECDIRLHSDYSGAAILEPDPVYPQFQFPKPFMISLASRQK